MHKVLVQIYAIKGNIYDCLQKTKPLSKQMTHLPKVTLECQCFDARIVKPMYPWRLVITTCQLPAPSQHMFHACHFHANVKVSYLCCKLISYCGFEVFKFKKEVNFLLVDMMKIQFLLCKYKNSNLLNVFFIIYVNINQVEPVE